MNNRFAQGPFRPVTEEIDCFDLRVDGRLPRNLTGTYLRTGPNARDPLEADSHHWFNGAGMLHALRLTEGRAEVYKSRFIDSADGSNRGDQDASGTVRLRRLRNPHGQGTGNASVLSFCGETAALEDLARPVGLDAALGIRECPEYARELPGAMVPHPKVEPGTGFMHVLSTQLEPPYLWYHIVSPAGETLHSTPLTGAGPAFYHDFCITETRLLVFDLPVTLSMEAAFSDHGFPFRWDARYEARVGVLPLGGDGRDVRWLPVDPCFVMHTANAWDQGDRILVDLVRHSSLFAQDLYGPADTCSALERWTLDPDRAYVTTEVLADASVEFPVIDRRWLGRRNRFTFAVEYDPANPAIFGNRVVRYDDQSRSLTEYRFDEDQLIGEVIFVPRPGSGSEAAGWLMGLLHQRAPGPGTHDDTLASEFIVLDAQRLELGPVARVRLPARVPLGQHGCWVERL